MSPGFRMPGYGDPASVRSIPGRKWETATATKTLLVPSSVLVLTVIHQLYGVRSCRAYSAA
jgi:hypothetical protein